MDITLDNFQVLVKIHLFLFFIFQDRHQHISRDITNLTLRFLHQKTATTITPTTSIPHSLKGL